jgi:hypothetical protein
MALLPPNLDYTDKDFDALRERLFALLKSVFPEWTDYAIANFGDILVELFCFVGDVLCYYMDANARESRIITATQRKSLLGLCKLIGYEPSGANAATADVLFSIASAMGDAVSIPEGTICATSEIAEPIEFQLLSARTIPAGSTSVTGTVEHSRNVTETFVSTGLANQEFTLGTTPFLDGSLVIVAGNGSYTEVDNFLSSTSAQRHFTVAVDQNDRATVRFGNGINGAVPTGTVTLDYKVGGGTKGNVAASAINRVSGVFTAGATPVIVRVTNPAPASGGTDRETNQQIRLYAPASLRALTRCVSKADFETVALRVDGVARALMLTSNESDAVEENTGILYIVPTGGGAPSSALKAAVLVAVTVTYPCTLTFQPMVYDPVYLTVDVQAVVYLRQGAVPATVKADIGDALAAFFAISNEDGTPNTNVDFGGNLKDADGNPLDGIAWSDVHNVVRDVSGVRKVDATSTGFLLNGEHLDVALDYHEFPVLGTVTLIDGDTGETL